MHNPLPFSVWHTLRSHLLASALFFSCLERDVDAVRRYSQPRRVLAVVLVIGFHFALTPWVLDVWEHHSVDYSIHALFIISLFVSLISLIFQAILAVFLSISSPAYERHSFPLLRLIVAVTVITLIVLGVFGVLGMHLVRKESSFDLDVWAIAWGTSQVIEVLLHIAIFYGCCRAQNPKVQVEYRLVP